MDLVGDLGHLALASRLKRLGELLQSQVSEVYAEQAESFRARWFPVLVALSRNSPLSIVQLAAVLGLTHTAVAQIALEMEGQGLVGSQQDPRDGRRRLLGLTAEGEATIVRMQPLWEEVRAATAELVAESGHDLLAAIAAVEERLAVRPMDDRLRARIARKPDLEKETSP
jgi:DNA-binding MarR family transcriptional regulator